MKVQIAFLADASACMRCQYRPKKPAKFRVFPDTLRPYEAIPGDVGGVPGPPPPGDQLPATREEEGATVRCPALCCCPACVLALYFQLPQNCLASVLVVC